MIRIRSWLLSAAVILVCFSAAMAVTNRNRVGKTPASPALPRAPEAAACRPIAEAPSVDFQLVIDDLVYSGILRERGLLLIDESETSTSTEPIAASGDGETVAHQPYPPRGACCLLLPDGTRRCVMTSGARCEAAGGSFQGPNSSCRTNPCNIQLPQVGACCITGPDGMAFCGLTTADRCLAASGAYQGDGRRASPARARRRSSARAAS